MLPRLPRNLLSFTTAVVALALVLAACGGSSEPKTTYVGFELYEGQYGLESPEDYSDGFRWNCDLLFETADFTDPEWLDRWGLRTFTINNSWDINGVGWQLVNVTEAAEDFRDFLAVHADESVINQCPGQLEAWNTPGTATRPGMDDPILVPVPPSRF